MLEEEYTEEKRQLKELDEKLQVKNLVIFSHQGTIVLWSLYPVPEKMS